METYALLKNVKAHLRAVKDHQEGAAETFTGQIPRVLLGRIIKIERMIPHKPESERWCRAWRRLERIADRLCELKRPARPPILRWEQTEYERLMIRFCRAEVRIVQLHREFKDAKRKVRLS